MPLLLVSPPDARFLKGGTENTLLIHIECLCRADLEAVAAADALIGLVGLALLDLDALMPADILAATAADTLVLVKDHRVMRLSLARIRSCARFYCAFVLVGLIAASER